MRAGEELESRALEHISKKYSFNFVKLSLGNICMRHQRD